MCKQDVQRCWNERPAWQIASTEGSLKNLFWIAKILVINHIYQCFFSLHTWCLPLPRVCFFARSAYSEMLPSFCAVGQLQAFLVAPLQKAQTAKINSNKACWTSHHYFLPLQQLKNCLSGTYLWYSLSRTLHHCLERITWWFISHQDKESAQQWSYILKGNS